jgi:programmed cell death 6-interacting protein
MRQVALCVYDTIIPKSYLSTGNYRYFGQLRYVEVKFPIDEQNIQIGFPWWTAFSKDKREIIQYNIHFEKASVLFNIGALYSKLGELESSDSDEGVRKACEYFRVMSTFYLYRFISSLY